MKYLDKIASLTPQTRRIICDKATEYPFSGEYNQFSKNGTYLCRRCGLALFRAQSQFSSGCGWPSFDDVVENSIVEKLDIDKTRMEILCARCDAHLGHVFEGENFTIKNRRHCVNSASIDWVNDNEVLDTEEAILAGGCFWGVEYFLNKIPGVIKVEVGYSGGHSLNPNYSQVCTGSTGHQEVVRVIYDKNKTNYETVLTIFFEVHDPTQFNGQGPDIGDQYKSAVFYYNEEQKTIAKHLINKLREKGYAVVTEVKPIQIFWPAEAYHQQYYQKNNKTPYCHQRVFRFKESE